MVQPVTIPVQDQRQQQSKNNAKKPNKNQKPVSLKQNHAAGQSHSQNNGTQPPACKQGNQRHISIEESTDEESSLLT